MDVKELRAVQVPVKKQYKEQPENARIQARAVGVIGEEDVTCAVPAYSGETQVGLHLATGGDGSKACSADTQSFPRSDYMAGPIPALVITSTVLKLLGNK